MNTIENPIPASSVDARRDNGTRPPEPRVYTRGFDRRVGFTLVELLVVIGIIAVLIALLLPGLAAARRSAQRTACAAKLHQVMLAAELHRNAHRGYYPLAGLVPGTTPEQLQDPDASKYDYYSATDGSLASRQLCVITSALETQMARSKTIFSPTGIMGMGGEGARESIMLDPKGMTSNFICPSHFDSPKDIQPQYVFLYVCFNGGTSLMEPQSYMFNEYVLGWFDAPYYNLRGQASRVRQPANTFFAADGLGGSTLASHEGVSLPKPMYTLYSTSPGLPVTMGDAFNAPALGGGKAGDKANFDLKRHSGKINIAYCDGHVDSRNISVGDLSNVFITPP